MRHGRGIQIYGKTPGASSNLNSSLCKYEGEWAYDKRHGRGQCVFLDESSYCGDFRNDEIEGNGVFTRPDGTRYDGEWSYGRMHGTGELTTATGRQFKGEFVNNCFTDVQTPLIAQDEAGMLINPMLPAEELTLYVGHSKQHAKVVRQAQERFEKRVRLHKVLTKQEFVEAFQSTRTEDKRMPLVLCSKRYERRRRVVRR